MRYCNALVFGWYIRVGFIMVQVFFSQKKKEGKSMEGVFVLHI